MRLFKFEEKESGVTHYTMGNNMPVAREKALEIANTPFEPTDFEWLHEDQMANIEIDNREEITLYAHSNPIKHSKKDWETIYEQFTDPLYLGCSEY